MHGLSCHIKYYFTFQNVCFNAQLEIGTFLGKGPDKPPKQALSLENSDFWVPEATDIFLNIKTFFKKPITKQI